MKRPPRSRRCSPRQGSDHRNLQPSPLQARALGDVVVSALHPQSFLNEIFCQEQAPVTAKLGQQAADRSRTLRQLLDILNGTVPDFASLVSDAISRK
jgi:hypothetical protein